MSECWTKSADRKHYGLAISCARRFMGRGVPLEELIGEAEAALLWAATRFDESRGTRFSSYAIPFVLGALREMCRRNAPMHVPREELRVLCATRAAREEWLMRDGREPTLAEISREVGVAPQRLTVMMAAGERMNAMTTDQRLLCTARDQGAGFEERVLLRDTVRKLGRPYAQVIWLRYFAGYSQEEIARKYKASQSQISRWESRGMEMLRQGMTGS